MGRYLTQIPEAVRIYVKCVPCDRGRTLSLSSREIRNRNKLQTTLGGSDASHTPNITKLKLVSGNNGEAYIFVYIAT